MKRFPQAFGVLLAVVVLLGGVATARATDLDLPATLAAIDQAAEAGALDAESALVAKFEAAFDPRAVGGEFARYRTERAARPDCGTPLILEAMAAWPTLSPATRERLSALASVPHLSDPASPPPPAAAAVPFPDGIGAPNSFQTTHFNIKWGNSGSTAQGDVEALGEHLEASWAKEVVDMGYLAPTATGSYLMDIYIGNTGDGVPTISFQGAYTTLYYDASEYMAYIVVHPDIITYAPASKEIAAHEFFHTLQFALYVDSWGYCYGMQDDQWMWEATATWAEDEVYPTINAYVSFLNVYSQNPQESLHSRVDFYYPYSRVLFFKYISEYRGGTDAVRQIWNACETRGTLAGVDEFLKTQGADLQTGFLDFTGRNATMDYEDGRIFDDVAVLQVHDTYPLIVDSIVSAADRPRYLGANYIRFEPDFSGQDVLTLSFNGADSETSKPVVWGVEVVLVRTNGAYDEGTMQLNDANEGTIEIPGFGTDYREVYMIPVVKKWLAANGTLKGIDYKYAAELSGGSSDDDDSDDDSSGSGSDGKDSGGCGC
jgi:hypothetical protein